MKTVAIGLCLVLSFCKANSQSDKAAGQVIEGSKLIVELIKVLKGKKEMEREKDCKNSHADLCVTNESSIPLAVSLFHRESREQREMVIPAGLRECCLQLALGIWTYDLRISEQPRSIRKGDLLLESCENITMNIKY